MNKLIGHNVLFTYQERFTAHLRSPCFLACQLRVPAHAHNCCGLGRRVAPITKVNADSPVISRGGPCVAQIHLAGTAAMFSSQNDKLEFRQGPTLQSVLKGTCIFVPFFGELFCFSRTTTKKKKTWLSFPSFT